MKIVATKRLRYNGKYYAPGTELDCEKNIAFDFVENKKCALVKGESVEKPAAPVVNIAEVDEENEKIEVSAKELKSKKKGK